MITKYSRTSYSKFFLLCYLRFINILLWYCQVSGKMTISWKIKKSLGSLQKTIDDNIMSVGIKLLLIYILCNSVNYRQRYNTIYEAFFLKSEKIRVIFKKYRILAHFHYQNLSPPVYTTCKTAKHISLNTHGWHIWENIAHWGRKVCNILVSFGWIRRIYFRLNLKYCRYILLWYKYCYNITIRSTEVAKCLY